MKNIYIHIGLGKTATTWLQDVIFDNHEDLNYLGKTRKNIPRWLIEWHYLDDYSFEKRKEGLNETVMSLCESDGVNLISSEPFTGLGGAMLNQAQRIKKIVPDARIIIILRDPIDMIKSFYKFNVETNMFILNLEDYLDWTRTPFVFYKRRPIYLPDLFFDEMIEVYEGLFGKDNICILKYEDIVSRTDYFFKCLGNFLNIEFKSEVIESALSVTVNKSLEKSVLSQKKSELYFDYLEEHFPSVAAKIDAGDIKKDIEADDELINEELAMKIKEYLKGKCYGYY